MTPFGRKLETEGFDPFDVDNSDLDWLGLGKIPADTYNPLLDYPIGSMPADPVEELVKIMCDTNYLSFTCRMLFNIELFPQQLVILNTLWTKKLPLLIGSRGLSKTFTLAIYILLRLVLVPGCRVAIVGSGFRQAKLVFDYMADVWAKAPVLRDVAGKGKGYGPKYGIDKCEFIIGTSKAIALPLGTGEKIRGIRAQYIIADEFASIDPEIFNLVVQGFGVVSLDPVQKVKQTALIKRLKEEGRWDEKQESLMKSGLQGNQIVYSGTASYEFNHFFQYFKKWRSIIASKGDPKLLADLLGDDATIMKGFNWKDYAIIRVPYTHAPPGLLDEGIIAQAKATLTSAQFNMEYCFDGSQKIITSNGLKPIKDVKVGDFVLTHKGRFKPVTHTMNREHTGKMCKRTVVGFDDILCTPEHRFITPKGQWSKAINTKDVTVLTLPDQIVVYQVVSNTQYNYSGLVYNLTVEDDNSYSLVNATVHNCAGFSSDSEGFYKRSTLEGATANKPILVPTGNYIQFSAMREGKPEKVYVMGVDPAADQDNAAIVIVELADGYRKIVYCWTTNRKKYNKFKKYMSEGGTEVGDDYYRYIAKKIRALMRVFNIERILMDKHGGGTAIEEALSSQDTCEPGETPIFKMVNPDDPGPNDLKLGLHMLELIIPTQDINSDANHGMLKDFQDKVLLFPMFDSIELAKFTELDNLNNIRFDTYEDVVMEIEELKNEITTIIVAPSSSLGKETFDTPQVKIAGARRGRLRKDRFSALLYANYYARNKDKADALKINYTPVGGTRETISKASSKIDAGMYSGPGLLRLQMGNVKGIMPVARFSRR